MTWHERLKGNRHGVEAIAQQPRRSSKVIPTQLLGDRILPYWKLPQPNSRVPLDYFRVSGVYPANRDARAWLTKVESMNSGRVHRLDWITAIHLFYPSSEIRLLSQVPPSARAGRQPDLTISFTLGRAAATA